MSNLYKAHVNTNKGEAYTRIIDYNELLEQKLSALTFERQAQLQRQRMEERKQQSGDEASEGAPDDTQPEFSEGLFGVSVEVPPELEIDYVERAKEQADEIVSKATADAETILKKAVQEAENLKETARKKNNFLNISDDLSDIITKYYKKTSFPDSPFFYL